VAEPAGAVEEYDPDEAPRVVVASTGLLALLTVVAFTALVALPVGDADVGLPPGVVEGSLATAGVKVTLDPFDCVCRDACDDVVASPKANGAVTLELADIVALLLNRDVVDTLAAVDALGLAVDELPAAKVVAAPFTKVDVALSPVWAALVTEVAVPVTLAIGISVRLPFVAVVDAGLDALAVISVVASVCMLIVLTDTAAADAVDEATPAAVVVKEPVKSETLALEPAASDAVRLAGSVDETLAAATVDVA